MTSDNKRKESSDNENPLQDFSGCHEGIINNFHQLLRLLVLINETPDSPKIKQIAKKQLNFFKEVVLEHHQEEEQELFTAVMESAAEGDEADLARKYIKRLVSEHRNLENMWKKIEDDIRRLSKGDAVDLDRATVERLAVEYLAHAEFEEQYFLPLSAKLLSKNDLSALGLSLHMRHMDTKILGYI